MPRILAISMTHTVYFYDQKESLINDMYSSYIEI
jgi:hypothetical protein